MMLLEVTLEYPYPIPFGTGEITFSIRARVRNFTVQVTNINIRNEKTAKERFRSVLHFCISVLWLNVCTNNPASNLLLGCRRPFTGMTKKRQRGRSAVA